MLNKSIIYSKTNTISKTTNLWSNKYIKWINKPDKISFPSNNFCLKYKNYQMAIMLKQAWNYLMKNNAKIKLSINKNYLKFYWEYSRKCLNSSKLKKIKCCKKLRNKSMIIKPSPYKKSFSSWWINGFLTSTMFSKKENSKKNTHNATSLI